MEKAQTEYRAAHRLLACRVPILLLSWCLTVGLILLGVRHMDRFSLYMVLSLVLGFAGTFLFLASAVYFGRKATALARQIVDLDIPVEEMLSLAARHRLDPAYIQIQLPDAER